MLEIQEAQCRNAHKVSRERNGSESEGRDRSKPYGWSAWSA